MAESTRLAKLPGYDTAPDVYETPELTDDTSTTAPTSVEPASDDGSSGDDEENAAEDGPFGGISRRRLFPERARSRFQAVGSRIDTKGLDLSDRIDGRRKGLRVKRQTIVEDESLDARIARLRREVEECRALANEESPAEDGMQVKQEEGIDTLSKALAELESAERRPRRQNDRSTTRNDTESKAQEDLSETTDQQTLEKVAIFDSRLTALERALGITSLDLAPDGSFTAPVLPSLNILDQQVSALMTSTSVAQINAASSRVQKLSRQAEQLASTTNGVEEEGEDGESTTTFSEEDIVKLNSLYNLLPTVQSLSPTVPALLERLRSLTAIHTGAANAADELDQLEKRQLEMDAELKSWSEGLEKIEAIIKDASEANGRNGKVVQGWVKDLEARVAAL